MLLPLAMVLVFAVSSTCGDKSKLDFYVLKEAGEAMTGYGDLYKILTSELKSAEDPARSLEVVMNLTDIK